MVNYEKIGFKSGLEIHQQLETHKLFCNCPSLVNDPNPVNLVFKRKLNLVAGETGEIDIAAKYEKEKDKEFIYYASNSSSCLVEYDEEPPQALNKEALDIALEIALLLNATIVDQIQFMRKIVIDGSNTTGFQRTALIAKNGFMETSQGKVEIQTICLEEEAAKKIEEKENSVIYKLDRLGVPLVEIVTATDIKSPQHAKEVAEKIGMVLRSTGKVKRGIGSIRQDVNISIKNGARTEIKGFQELNSIPLVIENEIKRQLKTTGLKNEVRKANSDGTTEFLRPMPGAARMYPETDIPIIDIDENIIKKIKLPELISDKAIRLEKDYNLNSYLARAIVKSGINFEDYAAKFKISPEFIAKLLVEMPKEIKSRFNLNIKKIKEKDYLEILNNVENEIIDKSAALEVLVDIAKGKKPNYKKYKIVSKKDIEKEIKKIIKKNKKISFNALMGDIMKKYRGKVDGKELTQLIKKFI